MDRHAGGKRKSDHGSATDSIGQYRTACFTCRAARQRCDRRMPCSRCTSQGHTCQYPPRSNRGRKEGSTNKPDSLEKLLARINDSPVKDEVIAAIVKSLDTGSTTSSPPLSDSSPGSKVTPTTATADDDDGSDSSGIPDTTGVSCPCYNLKRPSSVLSPLQIMASALTVDRTTTTSSVSQQAQASKGEAVDDRLLEYLNPRPTHHTDWQVLASQSNNNTLKLESTACDPVTARLVDQSDVALYFELFFAKRNPLVGLLDPALHTPEYVYSMSFTLFSAVCALGCAISERPRDRIIYPALISMAEANMTWSIAACVKSVEIIQTILCMKYWSPIHQRQADDPYWLHLSHAAQLARELGIHKPALVTEQANALSLESTADFREQLLRNFERTWLNVFIADKSFGIVTGRSTSIAWNELPPCPCQWWRKPRNTPLDRMISGTIEIRVQLLASLKQLEHVKKTTNAILNWHTTAFDTLERTRTLRCSTDDMQSVPCLAVLAFHIDHSIMVLNAQAMRDLKTIDEVGISAEFSILSKRTFKTSMRALDLVLFDPALTELKLGWHNNQFIMVAHAMTEVLHALKRGNLPYADVAEAASKVQTAHIYMEKMAHELPDTSAVHIYLALSRVFASEVEKILKTESNNQDQEMSGDPSLFMPDWLRGVNSSSLDPALWFDVGFLTVEQPNLNAVDPSGIEGLNNLTFN
ncbi:prib protein [Colletotrichum truncatum]|uniref:Prib protein n=1 Tax=Colletotrichum truncatum TaxID=5467 RepID=A0ACC3YUV9_COLTU